MTESNVSVTLNRLRSKLKEYLSERGYVYYEKEDLFDTLVTLTINILRKLI